MIMSTGKEQLFGAAIYRKWQKQPKVFYKDMFLQSIFQVTFYTDFKSCNSISITTFTNYNRRNQPVILSDFWLQPFCHTCVVKYQGHTQCHSQIIQREPKASLKKLAFLVKSLLYSWNVSPSFIKGGVEFSKFL